MIKFAQVSTSFVDYPKHLSKIAFVYGCNFCCPYCSNWQLWKVPDNDYLSTEDVISDLVSTRDLTSYCVISGGEPTIYPEMLDMIVYLDSLGMHIKLDTNGSNPVMLRKLLELGYLTYVAMDIKSTLNNYIDLDVEGKIDLRSRILESVQIIKEHSTPHEFRITVVPELVNEEMLEEWEPRLRGSKVVFQEYLPELSRMNLPAYISRDQIKDLGKKLSSCKTEYRFKASPELTNVQI